MIPLEECKDRQLYRVKSRNLNKVAVFNKDSKGFFGLRTKFDSIYIFEEYHWDTGEPFGTCNALEALNECLPEEIVLACDLGDECVSCGCLVKYDLSQPVETDSTKYPGEWLHLVATDCKNLRPCSKFNRKLFNWLKEMEAKYSSSDR